MPAKRKPKIEPLLKNHMVIRFDYNKSLVVPYEDGQKIIDALAYAEIYEVKYQENDVIRPLEPDEFVSSILSDKQYMNTKLAKLMSIPVEDVDEALK